MIDWVNKGGVIMYLLVLTSLISIAVIMERFNTYRKIEIRQNRFLKQLFDVLDVYQLKEAEELCQQNQGPLADIALCGLGAWDREKNELKEILSEAGNRQVPKLEANLGVLSTIAYTSPLIGLLGTVLGLIHSFQNYQTVANNGEIPGPGLLAGGIWQALITTVGGLTIGIVTQIIHNYLFLKKERMIAGLEESTQELLEILVEKRQYSTA